VVHLLVPEQTDPGAAAAVGFVVSRAVGGAVVRNRVKRRLRHLAAARLHRLPPGARVVVRALPRSATATGRQLEADLDGALGRVTSRLAGARASR
jgi:ribonuclease P protein component